MPQSFNCTTRHVLQSNNSLKRSGGQGWLLRHCHWDNQNMKPFNPKHIVFLAELTWIASFSFFPLSIFLLYNILMIMASNLIRFFCSSLVHAGSTLGLIAASLLCCCKINFELPTIICSVPFGKFCRDLSPTLLRAEISSDIDPKLYSQISCSVKWAMVLSYYWKSPCVYMAQADWMKPDLFGHVSWYHTKLNFWEPNKQT